MVLDQRHLSTGSSVGDIKIGDAHPSEKSVVFKSYCRGSEHWILASDLDGFKSGASKKASKWVSENKERARKNQSIWVKNNPERVKKANKKFAKTEGRVEYAKNWQRKNKDNCNAATARWREGHIDEVRQSDRDRYWSNPEKHRENNRNYQKNNPEVFAHHKAKRRNAEKNNIKLDTSDIKKIKEVYKDRDSLNLAASGAGCRERFQVDHIMPLQGKSIRGLHAPWNLQILTKTQNLEKGNSICAA